MNSQIDSPVGAVRSATRAGMLIAALVAAPGLHAELRAPSVGTVMVWTCDGPYTREYRVQVAEMNGDLVTYQGTRDEESYWVEKSAWLTGTTLWVKKSGSRFQWFDAADFANYRKLTPGARFKGAVPARDGDDKWVWDFQITIDQPQVMKHRVLGEIRIVPVSEKRRIYHGDYWSEMTSFLYPERGLTVRWIYRDPRGTEDCDLTAIAKDGQVPLKRKD